MIQDDQAVTMPLMEELRTLVYDEFFVIHLIDFSRSSRYPEQRPVTWTGWNLVLCRWLTAGLIELYYSPVRHDLEPRDWLTRATAQRGFIVPRVEDAVRMMSNPEEEFTPGTVTGALQLARTDEGDQVPASTWYSVGAEFAASSPSSAG